MTVESLASRLSVAVIGFFLTLASTFATVHAADNTRKTTVVSFGLFGDQGVFAKPPAQRKSSRIGSGVTQWS
jgi:hypothetical protein